MSSAGRRATATGVTAAGVYHRASLRPGLPARSSRHPRRLGDGSSLDPPEVPNGDPVARRGVRFDDDDVEPDRGDGQGPPVGEPPRGEEPEDGPPETAPLPAIDALLGEAEVSPGSPADLDGDELGRRPGIEGDEVEFVTPDADVAAEDPPATGPQAGGDERFGGITEALLSGSHRAIVAESA